MIQKIARIEAREILDSRGNPTVEVAAVSTDGKHAWASVPSGASTGEHEAHELRDGDQSRYGGKGVLGAVANVNGEITQRLLEADLDVTEQVKIDELMIELDGTPNKSRLGANAILGVSLAVARLASQARGIKLYQYIAELAERDEDSLSLPVPMFNIINGGKHADSGLAIQEFKVVPRGISGYAEQLRAGSEIFYALESLLGSKGLSTGVGNEGGFAPKLKSNEQALCLIEQAMRAAGYEPGRDVGIAIDAAANSFWDGDKGKYILTPENREVTADELVATYQGWAQKYSLFSVEDGLDENDWEGWTAMQREIGGELMSIGDDLLVTNVARLQKAIESEACSAVLIKPNQIGTLTETLDCMALASAHNMPTVVSHRSGDTCDDFIADLAVGAGAQFIKSGATSRAERTAKYNRLLGINAQIDTGV